MASREEAAHLRKIARFAELSRTGDKAECIDVPEDSAAWALATSTRENCLRQECPKVKSAALSWRRDRPCWRPT